MTTRRSLAEAALRRVFHVPPSGELPAGWSIELPGRGTTFVSEIPGPEGAPTIFLLHGLACTAYLNWYPALPALAGKYRVVMMDVRGHGRGIPIGRRLRLRDCAEDAVAVADALGIEKFIPVGYSMGGPVAQLIWERHPERVDGMVLCATARNFRGSPQERLFFMILPTIVLALGMRRRGSRIDPAEIIGKQLADLPADMSVSDIGVPSWAFDEFRRTSPWTMLHGVNAIGQFSSHRFIGKVDVPTAVVVTGRDSFIPPRRQRRLAEAITGATVHEFNGNHAACVLEADKFVPALEEAIESVVSRLPVPETLLPS
ncbi:MAG: alpha/beta hydrolase [Actinobacteria bacterium]|nr:alpha/beta hydrolase [Actinomycetota bacterium]